MLSCVDWQLSRIVLTFLILPRGILSSMRCVLGFDGGGTKTDCILMDEVQNILARSRSGPSNPSRIGVQHAIRALEEAGYQAMRAANVDRRYVVAICAGLAGTGRREIADEVRLELARVFPDSLIELCTDLEAALAAAGTGPAVVLVAGTGSAAIGRNLQGIVARAGGFGPGSSDEGSAYDIGKQALAVALARPDTLVNSAFHLQVLRNLGCKSWGEVSRRAADSPDAVFPRVFPVVAAAADSGDTFAQDLLSAATGRLTALVASVVLELGLSSTTFFLAKTGGMISRSSFFDSCLDQSLARIAPLASIGPLPITPGEACARVAWQRISSLEVTGEHHE